MKKILYIIVLLLLLPTLIMAGDIFYVGFGSINQFQLDLFAEDTPFASVVDVHNWATGGELRASLFNFNLEGYLLVQQGAIIAVTDMGKPVFKDDVAQRLFGFVGLGFSTKVAEFTTLSLAAGSLAGFDISPKFDVAFWMGERNNVYSESRWENFFMEIPLAYRMRLDLNLGGFTLGLHYQVPSHGFSYQNSESAALIPDWSRGKVGASFITRFF